ncbi:MAG: 16S rRNA (uracil(1498)-N(3))-methyltransferase [Planctomycetes bacterium]|nr:16S rRNA (uracil(1498)-N(3))-methyltransferase [Planctomycetota bacterium]
MSDRFFSAAPVTTERAILDGPEAHHLLHVMRAAVGEHVILFDDSGAEYTAVVETLGRADVVLRIVERREIDRELPFTLAVGVALPKGDRQKWLVEKLTELGVATLVPLATTRGVAQPTDAALDRLRRAVIEAAKQCGRNRLMRIAKPQAWDDWISQVPASIASDPRSPDHRRLLAHPGGTPLAEFDLSAQQATQLAIGPEGGLTDAEVAAATAAGWQTVELGPRILRVETAAVALTAAIALRA